MSAERGPGQSELTGRAWLAAMPAGLAAQRHVIAGLADRCATWPLATSLLVGCSLGRGAGDALSDIDAALGVDAERSPAGGGPVGVVADLVERALPELGPVVDVLRSKAAAGEEWKQRIFAQFRDGTQLDLAVVAQEDIRLRRRDGGAPDFVPVYEAVPAPAAEAGHARGGPTAAAYAVTGDQVREWAFLGWRALIDLDKYLRRGSWWEAHNRLQEARHHIWALWAAATGAMYPWHGLGQVLDNDPANLPPGIEATVAGLDPAGLRQAARASGRVLATVSAAAARRHPADLPAGLAAYVTRVLSEGRR